jgi:hypothetical protein
VVGNGFFRTKLWLWLWLWFAFAGDVRDEQWGIGNRTGYWVSLCRGEMEEGGSAVMVAGLVVFCCR